MRIFRSLTREAGFSLVELLVALALAGIVSVIMYMSFSSQSRSFIRQEQTVEIQQNVRAAMDIMARDIRLACYSLDRDAAGIFGPANLEVWHRRLNDGSAAAAPVEAIVNPATRPWGALTIRADLNGNGVLDPNNNEHVTYSLTDQTTVYPAGTLVLARNRNDGSNRQPLIGFVEGLAFAFAYADEDGDIIRDGDEIRWAVDTTGDNRLNVNIAGGPALDVGPENIRAVRIWLLVRSERQDRNMIDDRTYVLGHRTYTPQGDNRFFQRRLLTETVWIRNAGL